MLKRNLKLPKLSMAAFGFLVAFSVILAGQDFTAQGTAAVEDWSTHHVVFSNPGTFGEALIHGRLAQWSRTIGDPRYAMQQARRAGGLAAVAPEAQDIATLSTGLPDRPPRRLPMPPEQSGDGAEVGLWGASLSSSSAATVGAGMYPAKFTFNSNALACSNATQPDYAVFNTSLAGAAGGQATIAAYDNLYATTCASYGTVPTAYWAYNTGTGATAVTSPVISLDGSQVAFVQSTSSVASLVILKYKAGQGTPTAAAAPGTLTSTASTFTTCKTTGGASCALTLQFANDVSAAPNDTASSPFYDYQHDIIWVGDNLGYIHKFTGVFNGTPAEATSPWPFKATTGATPILNSPVYDSGASGLIFVTDQSGYLNSITSAGAGLLTSTQMECGTGFRDGPVVDSSNELVYAFIAYGCDSSHNSYINRFPAGTSISGSYGTALSFANGNSTTNSTASLVHAGAFDNTYYSGTGTTGHLYVCENGTLYQVAIASSLTIGTYDTLVGTRSPSDVCSPVSEYYNTVTSKDWIFMSLSAGGTPSVCTGACLYSFSVPATAGATTGTPTAGLATSGGSSGIIIDNSTSTTGGSQIYFSFLSAASATTKCPSPSNATAGGCAVQASQAALN